MKSVMQHNFSMIPRADIPRSSFDRSHGYKTAFNSGYLIPFYVDEALPGDTFHLTHSLFARLATPVVPFMDNCFLDVQYFAVPVRLVWDNFQKMCGEQIDPGDSTDYLVPQIVAPVGGFTVGSISDYFGLPVGVAGLSVSALWHRAYNLIINNWYRDENLQDSLPVSRDDGPDDVVDYALFRRGKRHDYFTCLPWPQKGPGVELPLGTSAPVVGMSGKSMAMTLPISGSPGPVSGTRVMAMDVSNDLFSWNSAPTYGSNIIDDASKVLFTPIYLRLLLQLLILCVRRFRFNAFTSVMLGAELVTRKFFGAISELLILLTLVCSVLNILAVLLLGFILTLFNRQVVLMLPLRKVTLLRLA